MGIDRRVLTTEPWGLSDIEREKGRSQQRRVRRAIEVREKPGANGVQGAEQSVSRSRKRSSMADN